MDNKDFLDPGEVSRVDDIHVAVFAVEDDVYLFVHAVENDLEGEVDGFHDIQQGIRPTITSRLFLRLSP